MSRGYSYKQMAEKYEVRDERILARTNYLEALKWFKRSKELMVVCNNKGCYKDDAKVAKYTRNVKDEYDNCVDKIKQLNGIYHLNGL